MVMKNNVNTIIWIFIKYQSINDNHNSFVFDLFLDDFEKLINGLLVTFETSIMKLNF